MGFGEKMERNRKDTLMPEIYRRGNSGDALNSLIKFLLLPLLQLQLHAELRHHA